MYGRSPVKFARTFGQDLMRGEHVVGGGKVNNSRRDADARSNLNNAPKKPEWAVNTGTENMAPGTSIFDPVLCELAYRWFCPPGGIILDPFAGGSVRGIVAAMLGRQYVGIDLREEQVAANREQAEAICNDVQPVWHVGDSRDIKTIAAGEYDFIFSCPPYGDLEVYSDDAQDLSTLAYDDFMAAYRQIIAGCMAMLKNDRFACFVVGDFRGKDGTYSKFPWHTIDAFEAAGGALYNEAVLVTAIGSLPIRVGRQFDAGRKLGKTHQNVLIFVKGNPKKATDQIGKVDFADTDQC